MNSNQKSRQAIERLKTEQSGHQEEPRIQIEKIIGTGTYGDVYKCFDRKLNRSVAVKKMKIPNDGQGIPSTVLREISLLRDLNHPTIIGLLDVIIKPAKILLIFEYLKQDLKQCLDSLAPGVYLPPMIVKVS